MIFSRIAQAAVFMIMWSVTSHGQSPNLSQINETDFAFYSYLAGKQLSPRWQQFIKESNAKHFKTFPALLIKNERAEREILAKVNRLSGAALINARRADLSANYFALSSAKDDVSPQILQMLIQEAQIVAVDETAKKVATIRDIDGLLASDDFLSKLAGRSIKFQTQRTTVLQSLKKDFKQLPALAKQYVTNGEARWAIVQEQWKRLSPKTKNDLVAVARKITKTDEQIPQNARYLENALIKYRNSSVNGAFINKNLAEKMGTFWGMSAALNATPTGLNF